MAHDVDAFKAKFNRDFVYGDSKDKVMDSDITKALAEMAIVFNAGLWASDAEADIAYLFGTAHLMVTNIRNAGGLLLGNFSQGIESRGEGALTSQSVGNVSIASTFPQSILNSPILSGFTLTGYGIKYLTLLTPYLVGNVVVVHGPYQA